jgi:hypothetical protein
LRVDHFFAETVVKIESDVRQNLVFILDEKWGQCKEAHCSDIMTKLDKRTIAIRNYLNEQIITTNWQQHIKLRQLDAL